VERVHEEVGRAQPVDVGRGEHEQALQGRVQYAGGTHLAPFAQNVVERAPHKFHAHCAAARNC